MLAFRRHPIYLGVYFCFAPDEIALFELAHRDDPEGAFGVVAGDTELDFGVLGSDFVAE
jgi:hypothetical protein